MGSHSVNCELGLLFNVYSDKVERAVSSCIYYLLSSGNVSRLHRIPCAETWHFYVGEPITVPTTIHLVFEIYF